MFLTFVFQSGMILQIHFQGESVKRKVVETSWGPVEQ